MWHELIGEKRVVSEANEDKLISFFVSSLNKLWPEFNENTTHNLFLN